MATNFRILQNLAAPFNPVESIARAGSVRALQLNNRTRELGNQLDQAKLDEIARANQSRGNVDAAARAAYQTPAPVTTQQPTVDVGGVSLPGGSSTVQGPAQFDRGAFLANLAQSDPMQAVGMQSQFASQDAATQKDHLDIAERFQKLDKGRREAALSQLDGMNQIYGAVMQADPSIRPQFFAAAVQRGKQAGVLAADTPEQYPGDQMAQASAMMGLKLADQFKISHENATLAETNRHNTATEGNQVTAQALTKRGQDLTDSRMREQNQIARDTKLEMNKAQDENQLAGFNASMDRLAAAANELKDHPGLGGITGKMGVLPNVPGGEAANAKAKLSTLKSQTAFSTLQDMRNNSKTGGALGQVSDKEGQLLQDNLAALDTAQSKEEYQKALQKIVDYSNAAKQRAKEAVDRKYGTKPAADPLKLF